MYLEEDKAERKELLEIFGIDENHFKENVDIIESWMEQQKRLPQDDVKDDSLIEMFLLNNKYRIEQTKTKIDNYYTMIRIHNQLFQDLWKVVPSKVNVFKIPLRKLTEKKERILLITKIPGFQESTFLEIIRAQILVSEMLFRFNYCSTQIVIIDMRGFSTNIFKGFEIPLLQKLIKTLRTCYSGRVAQIHIIHSSNWVSLLVSRLQKLYEGRVKVHKNIDTLYEYIPRERLPKDYGGEDLSLKEYAELWDEIVKEKEDLLRLIPTKTTDESLRIGKSMLDIEIFGVDGTFRKINID